MIIRNNRLDLKVNDIFICDLIDFWGESGAARNVEICGNTFGSLAGCNIEIKSCRPDSSNHLHENIKIYNNAFAKSRTCAIKASGVRNLEEFDNKFGGKND